MLHQTGKKKHIDWKLEDWRFSFRSSWCFRYCPLFWTVCIITIRTHMHMSQSLDLSVWVCLSGDSISLQEQEKGVRWDSYWSTYCVSKGFFYFFKRRNKKNICKWCGFVLNKLNGNQSIRLPWNSLPPELRNIDSNPAQISSVYGSIPFWSSTALTHFTWFLVSCIFNAV